MHNTKQLYFPIVRSLINGKDLDLLHFIKEKVPVRLHSTVTPQLSECWNDTVRFNY